MQHLEVTENFSSPADRHIAAELAIGSAQAAVTAGLIVEGSTVPFNKPFMQAFVKKESEQ